MRCVQHLVSDPTQAFPMMAWIRGREKLQLQEKRKDAGYWPTSYCYVGKLSKEWLVDFWVVCNNSCSTKKEQLTLVVLNSVDTPDIYAIRRRFYNVVVCRGKGGHEAAKGRSSQVDYDADVHPAPVQRRQ